LHDGGGDRRQTVCALPRIVRDLRSRGYRFVNVSKLLNKKRRRTDAAQR
jgi:peptidoglycan/xylan/chitin deacetylase (PgdA/CDA1 family)